MSLLAMDGMRGKALARLARKRRRGGGAASTPLQTQVGFVPDLYAPGV